MQNDICVQIKGLVEILVIEVRLVLCQTPPITKLRYLKISAILVPRNEVRIYELQ